MKMGHISANLFKNTLVSHNNSYVFVQSCYEAKISWLLSYQSDINSKKLGMEDETECEIPSDVERDANTAILSLLPCKPKDLYEREYQLFYKWELKNYQQYRRGLEHKGQK